MAMNAEDIVRVKIVGMQRAVFLPQELVSRTDGNRTYVKLAKARSEINRLLGQPLKAKGPNKRKLQFTSIIETLIQARDEKINAIVDSLNSNSDKKTRSWHFFIIFLRLHLQSAHLSNFVIYYS